MPPFPPEKNETADVTAALCSAAMDDDAVARDRLTSLLASSPEARMAVHRVCQCVATDDQRRGLRVLLHQDNHGSALVGLAAVSEARWRAALLDLAHVAGQVGVAERLGVVLADPLTRAALAEINMAVCDSRQRRGLVRLLTFEDFSMVIDDLALNVVPGDRANVLGDIGAGESAP